MKAYSLDLRMRVVDFVEAGNSRHAAAAHFGVSVSFVVKLIAGFRCSPCLRSRSFCGSFSQTIRPVWQMSSLYRQRAGRKNFRLRSPGVAPSLKDAGVGITLCGTKKSLAPRGRQVQNVATFS